MKRQLTRDGAILAVALGLTIYEIVLGGARPIALSFLSALLLSPGALHLDAARRAKKAIEAMKRPVDEEDSP